MHELYELKEMLCKELEEIGGKGELTAGSLETVDTLAHALKNLDKIIENKEADGYSMDGEYHNRYYRMGNRGYSYARGRTNARRDSMGRYSRDGYSWDDGKEDLAEQLRELGESSGNAEIKQKIERLAMKLEQM